MAAAFLAGALAALAMPPLYWLPLAVVGIVAFVWLWQTAPGPRSALLRGWAWGIGHFAVGSYWIVEAFFVPPADFALLGLPIVAGLAVLLGLLPGPCGRASRAGWSSAGRRWAGAIAAWSCWRSPGPWPNGCAATSSPAIRGIRSAMSGPSPRLCCKAPPLFGVYGLGTLTFLVLAAPTAGWRAVDRGARGRWASRASPARA